MNRHLIIPLVLADALAAIALAFGLGAHFAPKLPLFAALAEHGLGIPLMVVGAVGMVMCGPLMVRWFIASMRERSR